MFLSHRLNNGKPQKSALAQAAETFGQKKESVRHLWRKHRNAIVNPHKFKLDVKWKRALGESARYKYLVSWRGWKQCSLDTDRLIGYQWYQYQWYQYQWALLTFCLNPINNSSDSMINISSMICGSTSIGSMISGNSDSSDSSGMSGMSGRSGNIGSSGSSGSISNSGSSDSSGNGGSSISVDLCKKVCPVYLNTDLPTHYCAPLVGTSWDSFPSKFVD